MVQDFVHPTVSRLDARLVSRPKTEEVACIGEVSPLPFALKFPDVESRPTKSYPI